jgi:hypothetical protein
LELVVGPSYITGDENYTLDISTARVVMTVNNLGSGCNGADFFGNIGCQINAFFQSIWQWVGLFIGGLIFFFAGIFWFITAVGLFLGAIPTIMGFNGAPPIVTGTAGVIIIAIIFYIVLVFLGKARGVGNAG